LPHVSAVALEWGIAALLVGSGWYALAGPRPESRSANSRPAKSAPPARAASMAVTGFLVGVGSALTGTGGPLLLIPILVWRRLPMLTAVGLAQVIQIPVAALATLGNAAHGHVDWQLGAWLALAMVSGVAVGGKIAHALPGATLHKLVAALLVAVGVLMAGGLLSN